MATILTVRNDICEWFGGPYDTASRAYRTPQVAGLGVVRRSRPKAEDQADYYLGQSSSGAVAGATMLVHVDSGTESRAAMAGPFAGLKLLVSQVVLHVFLTSNAAHSEDAQDAFYELLERLKARIRADRCMGTGGFEDGGFDIGEGGEPWLAWQMAPAEVKKEVTTAYLSIQFDARYYESG